MLKNCVVFGIVRLLLLLLLLLEKKFQFVAQFVQRCHAQHQPCPDPTTLSFLHRISSSRSQWQRSSGNSYAALATWPNECI